MQISDVIAVCLVAIIWGLNFVVIKLGLESFPPLLFSALRFFLVALAIFFVPRPPVKTRYILSIGLVLGVVKFSLLFAGMYVGIGAGMASIVLQSQVFFTVVLSFLLFGERPKIFQIIGLLFGFSGMVVISGDLSTGITKYGFLMIICAAAAWAVANILMRQTKGSNPLSLMVWISAVPVVPLLGLSLMIEGPSRIAGALENVGPSGVAAILYVAIMATLLGYSVWGRMLTRYPAATVTPFALLVPVAGLAGGRVFLGEHLGLRTQAGIGLVLTGLLVTILGGGLIRSFQEMRGPKAKLDPTFRSPSE